MCYLIVRQGPEGRRLNIAQPGRAGYRRVHPSAVGAALYRALPNMVSPYPLATDLIQRNQRHRIDQLANLDSSEKDSPIRKACGSP